MEISPWLGKQNEKISTCPGGAYRNGRDRRGDFKSRIYLHFLKSYDVPWMLFDVVLCQLWGQDSNPRPINHGPIILTTATTSNSLLRWHERENFSGFSSFTSKSYYLCSELVNMTRVQTRVQITLVNFDLILGK